MKTNLNKSGIVGKMQFVLPFVMLFGLSACNSGGGSDDGGGNTNPPPVNPPPTPSVKTFPGQLGVIAPISGENWDLLSNGLLAIDVKLVDNNASEASVGTFQSDDPDFTYPTTRNFIRYGLIGEVNQDPDVANIPAVLYSDRTGADFIGTVCVDLNFFEEFIVEVQGDMTGKLKFTQCTLSPADLSDTWVPALIAVPGPNEAAIVFDTGINVVNDDVDPNNRFPVIYLGESTITESGNSTSGLTFGPESAVLFGIADPRTGAVCLPFDIGFGYVAPKIVAEDLSYPYTKTGLAAFMGDDLAINTITFVSNCVFNIADYQ